MKKRFFTTAAIATGFLFFAGTSPVVAFEIQEKLNLSGTIEVEFNVADSDEESSNKIELATADFGLEAALTNWATGTLNTTWNGDDDKFEVDEAFITLADEEVCPVSLQAGRFVVPFGAYEGEAPSPLTNDIFETKEDAIMVGFNVAGFHIDAYTFNGDTNEGGGDPSVDKFGFAAGYDYESEGFAASFGLGYINSVMDSDALSEGLAEGHGEMADLGFPIDENKFGLNADYAGGLAANTIITVGPVALIGEYITLIDDYKLFPQSKGIKPNAWQLEAVYTVEIAEKETIFALGYSKSEDLHGGIAPETRLAMGASVGLGEGVSVAAEYTIDEDYSVADGGTGDDATLFTLRLAYEF